MTVLVVAVAFVLVLVLGWLVAGILASFSPVAGFLSRTGKMTSNAGIGQMSALSP